MIAIVDHLEGDGHAPQYLRWAWTSQKHGAAFTGGWLDWPAGEITKMDWCELAYNTLAKYTKDGIVPPTTDKSRYRIIEDYTLMTTFARTGIIPPQSEDNDFHERTLEFRAVMDG